MMLITTTFQKPKQILIVDDSIDNQVLLTTLLNSKGYEVHTTSNGQEALDLLGKLSKLPDLILLDVQMPVMDGYQFRTEQIKTHRLQDIPVVVMTASQEDAIAEKMLVPNGVLAKPLDCAKILQILSVHI